MFKNVGKELKIRASGILYKSMIVYALILGAAVLAVVEIIGNQEYYWALVAACIGVIVGEIVGRNKAIKMYAFGELVEYVSEIKKILGSEEKPLEDSAE